MAPPSETGRTGPRLTRLAAILLFIGLAALMSVVAASYRFGTFAQQSFDAVVAARGLSGAADSLRYSLQSAEASQRGYLLTGNQIYLAPFGTATAEVERRLSEIDAALGKSASLGPAVERLSVLIADKLAEMDASIGLKREGRDGEALALVETNRGKALMDEANLFISRFVRVADADLREAAENQRYWLLLLRGINYVAALLLVLVVGTVVWMVSGFVRSLSAAQREVTALNRTLEQRIEERTSQLAAAKDRAELLMAEVNHRVANSLTLVASMVRLQARAAPDGTARELLNEVHDRVYAVALVHKRLYASGDVRSVDLGDYLSSLLEQLDVTMRQSGHQGVIKQNLMSLPFPTDKSVNLGVIATELVTNAFKYAYPDKSGEIRIELARTGDDWAELVVQDDGVGRSEGSAPKGTGLGSKLIGAMAASLEGQVEYRPRPRGTEARVTFPLKDAR